MFLGYRDRVWERTTSTGTGDLLISPAHQVA